MNFYKLKLITACSVFSLLAFSNADAMLDANIAAGYGQSIQPAPAMAAPVAPAPAPAVAPATALQDLQRNAQTLKDQRSIEDFLGDRHVGDFVHADVLDAIRTNADLARGVRSLKLQDSLRQFAVDHNIDDVMGADARRELTQAVQDQEIAAAANGLKGLETFAPAAGDPGDNDDLDHFLSLTEGDIENPARPGVGAKLSDKVLPSGAKGEILIYKKTSMLLAATRYGGDIYTEYDGEALIPDDMWKEGKGQKDVGDKFGKHLKAAWEVDVKATQNNPHIKKLLKDLTHTHTEQGLETDWNFSQKTLSQVLEAYDGTRRYYLNALARILNQLKTQNGAYDWYGAFRMITRLMLIDQLGF